MSTLNSAPGWMVSEPPGGERALPVYLLLDTSGSMRGVPIESLTQGLEQFQKETSDDPFARDVVKVGLITFDSGARLLDDKLVPIAEFKIPHLVAEGWTRLDLAFLELAKSMDRDISKPKKGTNQKGDWRPMVFVLTDGYPTDENGGSSDTLWRAAREAVMKRPAGSIKPSTIVAVGCGVDVKDETLREISTGTAFRMGSESAAFNAFLQFVTQSVISAVQPGSNPEQPAPNVPPPPGSVVVSNT